jgi:hypothetical protein
MNPSARYYGVLCSATIAVMFTLINVSKPLVQSMPEAIAGLITAVVASLGVYRGIYVTLLIDFIIKRSRWLKRKLLGALFLEGPGPESSRERAATLGSL